MKAFWAAVVALVAPTAARIIQEPEPVSHVLSDLLIRDASKEDELRSEHEKALTLSNEAEDLRERLRGKDKVEKKLRKEAKLSDWAWSAIRASFKRDREKERRFCSNRTATLQRQVHACESTRKECRLEHAGLNQELVALRQDLEWERARRVDAEAHVQELAKKLSTMAADMAAKPSAVTAEDSEVQALRKELSMVSADLAGKSNALHAAQAALKTERENFEKELPALHTAESKEAKELRAEHSWRLSATKDLATTQRRLIESGTKLREVRSQIVSKDKELNETREELKEAHAAKAEAGKELSASREKIATLTVEVSDLKKTLETTNDDVQKLRAELKMEQQNEQEVGKELSASREKTAALMMEVFDLRKTMKSQNGNMQNLRAELKIEQQGEQELNKTRNILAAKDRELSHLVKRDDEALQAARKEARTKDLEVDAMRMKVTSESQDLKAARMQASSESKEVKALRIESAIAKAGAKAAHAEQNILGILTKELNESRVAFAKKLQELDITRKELDNAKKACVQHSGAKDAMNMSRNTSSAESMNTKAKAEARAEAKVAHSEEQILGILTKELNESRIAFAAKIQELDHARKQLAGANECCAELRSKDSVNQTKTQAPRKALNQTHKELQVKDQELEAARLLIKTLEDNSKLEKK